MLKAEYSVYMYINIVVFVRTTPRFIWYLYSNY